MSSADYHPAPYDRLAAAVTLCVFVGMIALTVFFYYLFLFSLPASSPLSIVVVGFITALTLVMLIVPFLFSPRGYKLTSTELIIQRPIRNIIIPYNQITDVNQRNWSWKGVRIAGSGGLYGYLGLFYFSDVGKVWMYVTNKNKMITVKCKNSKQYIISPNSQNFVGEIQNKMSIQGT
jgi:hypothetical protein